MGKNTGKNISKILSGKYSLKLLDHAKQSTKDALHLKLIQKELFKKQQKQLVIWLVIKFLIELRKFEKIHNNIIQRQLQIIMIKKYPSKDIYLQKKERKLLTI